MSDDGRATRRNSRQSSRRQPSNAESTARRREAQIRRAEEEERRREERRNLWITNPTALVLDQFFRQMTAWELHNRELLYRFAGQPNRDEMVREAIRQELRQYEAIHGPLPRSQTEWMTSGTSPQIEVMPPGVERSPIFWTTRQEDRTRQEARQREAQEYARLAAEQAPVEESKPFPKCSICQEYMNNLDGPADRPDESYGACSAYCNDVVNVCINNHLFHRGCILNSCKAGQVNTMAQMNNSMYDNYVTQAISSICPLCRAPLKPNCEGLREKRKVLTQNIGMDGMEKQLGGKRRRNKTRKQKHKKPKKTNKHISRKIHRKFKK